MKKQRSRPNYAIFLSVCFLAYTGRPALHAFWESDHIDTRENQPAPGALAQEKTSVSSNPDALRTGFVEATVKTFLTEINPDFSTARVEVGNKGHQVTVTLENAGSSTELKALGKVIAAELQNKGNGTVFVTMKEAAPPKSADSKPTPGLQPVKIQTTYGEARAMATRLEKNIGGEVTMLGVMLDAPDSMKVTLTLYKSTEKESNDRLMVITPMGKEAKSVDAARWTPVLAAETKPGAPMSFARQVLTELAKANPGVVNVEMPKFAGDVPVVKVMVEGKMKDVAVVDKLDRIYGMEKNGRASMIIISPERAATLLRTAGASLDHIARGGNKSATDGVAAFKASLAEASKNATPLQIAVAFSYSIAVHEALHVGQSEGRSSYVIGFNSQEMAQRITSILTGKELNSYGVGAALTAPGDKIMPRMDVAHLVSKATREVGSVSEVGHVLTAPTKFAAVRYVDALSNVTGKNSTDYSGGEIFNKDGSYDKTQLGRMLSSLAKMPDKQYAHVLAETAKAITNKDGDYDLRHLTHSNGWEFNRR